MNTQHTDTVSLDETLACFWDEVLLNTFRRAGYGPIDAREQVEKYLHRCRPITSIGEDTIE